MEPFSVAASVLGVVGLLIQLAEAINKIHKFMIAIEDVPADIREVIEEIEFLNVIFEGMQEDEQRFAMAASLMGVTPDTKILNDLLQTCARRMSDVTVILTELDLECKSSKSLTRKWNMIKGAFRGTGTIKKFSDSLNRLKLTLMLAQQWSTKKTMMEMAQSQHENLKRMMELQSENLITSQRIEKLVLEQPGNTMVTTSRELALTDDSALLTQKSPMDAPSQELIYSQPQKKPSQRDGSLICCFNSLFSARFYYTVAWSNEGDEDQNADKFIQEGSNYTRREYQFCYRPNSWLQLVGLKHGFNVALSIAQRGWKNKVKIFNAVPAEAPIFRLSRAGDVNGMKDLFSSKKASIWDVDDSGNTALHYAAASCHIKLCQMLIHAGADMQARNFDCFYVHNKTPLAMMCERGGYSEHKIDLIRLFSHGIDFWDETSEGWDVLTCLLYAASKKGDAYSDSAPLKWVFSSYGTDMVQSPVRNIALSRALIFSDDPVSTGLIMQMHEQIVTESFSLNNYGYNILHYTLYEFNFDPIDRLEMLKLFCNLGVDLHLLTESNATRDLIRQSPMSLAMRHSYLFSIWKKLLSNLGLDFESFIRAEFKANSVLKDAGWTEETLLRLFEVEYEPRYLGISETSFVCITSGCRYSIDPEEPWWLWLQETIRTRRDTLGQPEQLRLDRQISIWRGRYQSLEAIPRSINSDSVWMCRPCYVHEFSWLPSNRDDDKMGEDETTSQRNKQMKQKREDVKQGICLAWPSLCERCEKEAKRKQLDLERKRREGCDGDDDDEYGDSMFLLNLEQIWSRS